jgi:hypothetical protein
LFLTFSVFKASLVAGGSMVSKFPNASPLWPGDECAKDTNHCVRNSLRHRSGSARFRNERQLDSMERTVWTRHGTVLVWSDPTFAQDSVAKVIRGSLQTARSPRGARRGKGEWSCY